MSGISEKAMLVQLTVKQWSAQKRDVSVGIEVSRQHNAAPDAGAFYKKLVDSYLLDEFKRVAAAARAYHASRTLPWYDNGMRVLPISLFEEYSENMRKLQQDADIVARRIGENYDRIIENAKNRLGDMFNINDFPTASELRHKFALRISLLPIPDISDWRADISAEAQQEIKSEMMHDLHDRQKDAMKEVWNRLYALVEHAQKRMENDGALHTSVINNIKELVKLLPHLNIVDDPDLKTIAKEVEDALCGHDVAVLRKDRQRREEVAKEAKSILAKMYGYGTATAA